MRYAVLYLLDGVEDAEPCGVAIERSDCVEVIAPAEMGLPSRLTEPFDRMGPDLSIETIRPGDDDYFSECCGDLHRAMAISRTFEWEQVPA